MLNLESNIANVFYSGNVLKTTNALDFHGIPFTV